MKIDSKKIKVYDINEIYLKNMYLFVYIIKKNRIKKCVHS